MGHNLEILEDGTASMAYSGKVPWHGLGHDAGGLMTAAEAIKLARLDWTVSSRPLFIKGSKTKTVVRAGNLQAITRDSDERVYGAVTGVYKPLQNLEAFGFFDLLVDSGEAKYETAGSLAEGRRVWMTAKVGDTMLINEEEHDLYMLLINSHDGLNALQVATTMIRVVCQNTEQMALRSAKSIWSMTHRDTIEGKAVEAREALGLSFKYKDAYEEAMRELISIKVTPEKFQEILRDRVLPEQKRQTEKNIAVLTSLFTESPTIKGTVGEANAWGAYNALTEWTSHRPTRTQEAKMISNLNGGGAQLRGRMHKALAAL